MSQDAIAGILKARHISGEGGAIKAARGETQALELLKKNPDMKPYQAAEAVGVGNAAVYQALQRTKGKTVCPCCGQVVREGFEINRAVLKTGK